MKYKALTYTTNKALAGRRSNTSDGRLEDVCDEVGVTYVGGSQ